VKTALKKDFLPGFFASFTWTT